MIRILGVIVVLLGLADTASALNCHVPRIRTLADQTVDGFMTVKSGRQCSIKMITSRGPTHAAKILAQPSHGGARIDAGNRVVYLSRSGYVGGDTFTYARVGLDTHNHLITRTVRIEVSVIP